MEFRTVDGVDVRRIAVPASLFGEGPEPPFVLFDRRGGLADPAIARTVYVAPSDVAALDRFLTAQLRRLMESRRVAEVARAWALQRVLVRETAQALASLPEPGALRRLLPTVELAAIHVGREPGPYLAEVAHSTQSPETSAVATALFAVTLAVAEGIEAPAELVEMAIGGLFACGAAAGPDHPAAAAELLHAAGLRTRSTLEAVRLHHERWGGGGYPDGRRGETIPLEARILRIATAYAALTADRPEAAGMRGYEALLEMARSDGEFEPRLLRSYVRALGRALNVNARWTPPDEREHNEHVAGAA